jgi:SAM-dependent methyltransferase
MTTAAADLDDASLLELLELLREHDYRHTTVTPLTHARVLAHRSDRPGRTLADVFGWNLPFAPDALPAAILDTMRRAGILQESGGLLKSRLRVSSLDDLLLLHSGYPTEAADAVFFGPDTYRFVRFMQAALERQALPGNARILDIGCGSGAGALALARHIPEARIVLNDINPLALRLAAINARAADIPVELLQADGIAADCGKFDAVIANPPYLVDASERTYRHGGARLGRELSVRIAESALNKLAPGGRLMLYTGVAIVDGVDGFLEEMRTLLDPTGCAWRYTELDPDVFGEELEQAAYWDADRIAVIGLEAMRLQRASTAF